MTLQRWTLRCYRLTYRAISSLMPTLNTSVHRCLRWRSPPHSQTKQKTVATLFITPPGFLSSSSCQLCLVSGREWGRPRTGGPDPTESHVTRSPFSAKTRLFFSFSLFFSFCDSHLGSGCELRITPQWPRLTFVRVTPC